MGEMHWEKSVPTSFVSDSGDSGFRSSDKRGLTDWVKAQVVARKFCALPKFRVS